MSAVATVRRAMPDDWRATAFYLERRYPAEWAKTNRHELSGAVEVEQQGREDLSRLTFDELEAYQRLREKVRGEG